MQQQYILEGMKLEESHNVRRVAGTNSQICILQFGRGLLKRDKKNNRKENMEKVRTQ